MYKIVNIVKMNPFFCGTTILFTLGILLCGWSFLALSNAVVTSFVFIGIMYYFTRDIIGTIIKLRWPDITIKDVYILSSIAILLLLIRYS